MWHLLFCRELEATAGTVSLSLPLSHLLSPVADRSQELDKCLWKEGGGRGREPLARWGSAMWASCRAGHGATSLRAGSSARPPLSPVLKPLRVTKEEHWHFPPSKRGGGEASLGPA